MVIGRSNTVRELANLCVEVRPLLKILNEQGYDIDKVQDARIQLRAYRGPVMQLFSQGMREDIEFPLKIWEVVENYFWRDTRKSRKEPRFMFNWS